VRKGNAIECWFYSMKETLKTTSDLAKTTVSKKEELLLPDNSTNA